MNRAKLFRHLMTATVFALAALISVLLWQHYMNSPWTRDGRVKVNVINLAPEVSGVVAEVLVHDNQLVRKGDVLLRIDRERFRLALNQAQATLDSLQTDAAQRRREAARRKHLANDVITAESRDTASARADAAGASVDAALASRDLAALNLNRTELRAPVDGYVTNLNIHAGDFATAGRAVMAVLDSHSFRVEGYFEETKIPEIRPGDVAEIRLMSGPRLTGRVESVSRGITDRDNADGQQMLANVNPSFSWVRLAQRIPVRIAIDKIPDDVQLIAGMTCTVVVRPAATTKAPEKPG